MEQAAIKPVSFLKHFAILTGLVFIIFSLTIGGTTLFSHFFEEKRIAEGTEVASIPLGNLTEKEAVEKLGAQVQLWRENSAIYLQYKRKKIKIDPAIWTFHIQETVKTTERSALPRLLVELNEKKLNNVVEGFNDPILLKNIDEALLKSKLTVLAASLGRTATIQLTNYVKESPLPSKVIASTSIPYVDESPELKEWVHSLNGTVIDAGKQLSFVSQIEKKRLKPYESQRLNLLASAIYSAALKTNFRIVERHIGETMPTYIKPGLEAAIVPGKQDLVIENPNPYPYTLKLETTGGVITATIEGPPLHYRYHIKIKEEWIQPRTIVHYNPAISPGDKILINEGSFGYVRTVYRKMLDKYGKAVKTTKIAEDYYPPQYKIEERGLPVAKEQPSPTNSEDQDTTQTADNAKNDETTTDTGKKPDKQTPESSSDKRGNGTNKE
ncbi:VanW family protein [Fictibacillus gelatini]|uniref:VanW family protein n=1 Tax=Fictibacillus gelatini TaxID=225985 RepID=UPI0003F6E595|nr:VanW family protein [Fictibacillus gelatini]